MIFNLFLSGIVTCLLSFSSLAQEKKPKVVILGVEHSSQLINASHQPAVLRAFIEKVGPSGICIERSPEEFLRGDFYEFTYEQQNVVIPFAQEKQIPLFPIDWLPEEEDLQLAFGTSNLEVPNFTRNPQGFWGFTVFPDTSSYQKRFFFADEHGYTEGIKDWYQQFPQENRNDFPRRLFLYRTFLQAKRVQAVLRKFNERDTILVVVGALHKDDIENNLKGNGYEIISPEVYSKIDAIEINNHFRTIDALAICSFNLLGMQAHLNVVNKELVNSSLKLLKKNPTPETEFFEVKANILFQKINSESAIKRYKELLEKIDESQEFTWNGVKDKRSIDSYFDPFGNLTLDQRINLEIARELYFTNSKLYEDQKKLILNQFQGLKRAMLEDYWLKYVAPL